MKSIIAVILVCVLDRAALAAVVSKSSKIVRGPGKVQAVRLHKCSTDSSHSYNLRINGLGEDLDLNLQSPSNSIFSPNFKYLEISADSETKELRVDDKTPSEPELKSIVDNFYTDAASNTAVSIKFGKTEEIPLRAHGRIDSMSLTHNEGLHELIRQKTPPQGINDYIDLNLTITPVQSAHMVSSVSPEVHVIFDYANSKQFDHDRTKILDYLGVFFHAVNNRFGTARDPKISFKISGVTTITKKSAQPFMENHKVPGGYNINKVLEDFSKWTFKNMKTPKHDLVALITGTDMLTKQSNGKYTSGVAGLAYLNGACISDNLRQQYRGVSVTEDIGGFYMGVIPVAHELAHNMGAPHDGEKGAESCPWNDGFMMSYEGWGTSNKFHFSPCSLRLMKKFINSREGSCTTSQQISEEIPVSEDNVGDRYTMDELCVKHTNDRGAFVDPYTGPSELCKSLSCVIPDPNNPYQFSIHKLSFPPGDYSACGNGGKCIDGECVGSSDY